MFNFKKQKLVFFNLFLVFLLVISAAGFDKVKFVCLADLHFDLHGRDGTKMAAQSSRIIQNTIQEVNQVENLNFVIVAGDLLYDGEPWNLDWIKTYLEELKVPYFVVLGNHDISPVPKPGRENVYGPAPPGISKATFVWAFQGHGFADNRTWWSRSIAEGLQIIGLDTVVPGTWGGKISGRQLRWLDKELQKHENDFCIVIVHHCLVNYLKPDEGAGKNFIIDNASATRRILSRHPGVKLVISGHHHLSTRFREIEGVYYFQVPSLSSYPLGYVSFEITPAEINWETFPAPIEKKIVEQAKTNLLKDSWWREVYGAPGREGDKTLLGAVEGKPEFLSGSLPVR